jgi:uncharacterized protein YbaR (Trm112 family)
VTAPPVGRTTARQLRGDAFTWARHLGFGQSSQRTPDPFGPFSRPRAADKLVYSMAISERLLEILVCPLCKAKVVLKEDGSGLKCVACHRVYPVRDDIPIMMVDQATIEA